MKFGNELSGLKLHTSVSGETVLEMRELQTNSLKTSTVNAPQGKSLRLQLKKNDEISVTNS